MLGQLHVALAKVPRNERPAALRSMLGQIRDFNTLKSWNFKNVPIPTACDGYFNAGSAGDALAVSGNSSRCARTFPIDLLWSRAEPPQDVLDERQRDLAFTRIEMSAPASFRSPISRR
jgi:hypothetical protein